MQLLAYCSIDTVTQNPSTTTRTSTCDTLSMCAGMSRSGPGDQDIWRVSAQRLSAPAVVHCVHFADALWPAFSFLDMLDAFTSYQRVATTLASLRTACSDAGIAAHAGPAGHSGSCQLRGRAAGQKCCRGKAMCRCGGAKSASCEDSRGCMLCRGTSLCKAL